METERIAYRRRAVFPTWRHPAGIPARLLLLHALPQPRQHDLRDLPADVSTILGYLLDQAGAQERVQRVGGHEQRLDLGHPVVHLRHLHLVLEVADGAQALDHRGDPVGRAEVHQQAVEPLDPDVAVAAGDLAEHLDPLVDREQALLGHIDQHRDDHLVVEPRGAADDVEVTVGDRIKRTRTDYALHAAPSLLLVSGNSRTWTTLVVQPIPGPDRTRTSLPRTGAPGRARTRPARSAPRTWWRARRSPARRAPARHARRAVPGPGRLRRRAARRAGRRTPRRRGPGPARGPAPAPPCRRRPRHRAGRSPRRSA